MIDYAIFLLIVALVVVVVFRTMAGGPLGSIVCPTCGATHPPTARFCRRCGKKL